jgi:predicted TIM-barrel fold metal-dependent hydrolase
MTVIDADAHVIESELTWAYLTEDDRKYAPMILEQTSGDFGQTNRGAVSTKWWMFETNIQPGDRNINVEDLPAKSREMADVKQRLDHMNQLGIDIQVLYTTIFLSPCATDAAAEFALYHSYNQWLADIWKEAPDRLYWGHGTARIHAQDP